MVSVLFILAPNGFRDEEFFEPKEVLESSGHTCVVGSTEDACQGSVGAMVMSDVLCENVEMEEYALLVLVGGPGAPELAHEPSVMNLIKAAKLSNKLIAAICIAPTLLAKAGVIEGKKVTVYYSRDAVNIIQNVGKATFVNEPVVVDGKIITANGPESARLFGQTLAEVLA